MHGSKHTIYCQANPQIWPKINDFGATLAQITCARDCRQLQNHYSVKTGSQARIINADVGILHDIVIQPQHFLPSWPPVLAKNEQLQGWVSPNHMCAWLQTSAWALQRQNWLTSKVDKAQDGNRTWYFCPNTPFTAKMAPTFGKKRTVWGLVWPKLHLRMIGDSSRGILASKLVDDQGCDDWDGNRTWYFKSTTTFSAKLTLNFGQKRAPPGLIWPKWYLHNMCKWLQIAAEAFQSQSWFMSNVYKV